MLLADHGYDADWIRELAMKKGAWANIPPKRNRSEPICFRPYLYRARNRVERFFNRIKQCRRVATRYDKLAANYLAFVQPASIRIWLGANESTSLVHHSAASRASRICPSTGTVTNSAWNSRSPNGRANDAYRCSMNVRSHGTANQSNAIA
jgi:transposase